MSIITMWCSTVFFVWRYWLLFDARGLWTDVYFPVVQENDGEAYDSKTSTAEELDTLIKGTIAGGGVIPHIHKSLINKSSKK
ncbi:hypothetical protein VNO78_30611 [Psophocarpus tetragonolobus]|uniref:Histone H2A C-terminal domain-containing protein n=1 Tax=Psophocarpus tetragonolobus TaxID=3891 RepID=A0AAN9RWW2_PSOTE